MSYPAVCIFLTPASGEPATILIYGQGYNIIAITEELASPLNNYSYSITIEVYGYNGMTSAINTTYLTRRPTDIYIQQLSRDGKCIDGPWELDDIMVFQPVPPKVTVIELPHPGIESPKLGELECKGLLK